MTPRETSETEPPARDVGNDHLRDACGVFGIFGHSEAAHLTCLGLHALQHRGQESAGIVVSDGVRFARHLGQGLVAEVFDGPVLDRLVGTSAVGHVRYSTAGGSGLVNAQPIAVRYAGGEVAVAHNGTLTNAEALRTELEGQGSIFSSTSDTEVIVHLIARSRGSTLEARLVDALTRLAGAWSLTVLGPDQVIGARDPHGVRPLVLGKLGDAHVLASETSALNLIGARWVRDIEPGEVVVIDTDGVRSVRPAPPVESMACVFEHVYFARPDSRIFGGSVYAVRKALGERLADESPAKVDVVIPVPDSGTAAAIGFAARAGIPFGMGLVRSHYVGRTFIEPAQTIRHFGVRLKLAPVREVLEGQRVAVIDDSLVRGTTSQKIIALIRSAGASEVHLRISSPPITHPCYYGIDTPERDALIAAHHSVEAIRAHLGCESLAFLSREGMLAAARSAGGVQSFCDACFSGRYPIPPPVSVTEPRRG